MKNKYLFFILPLIIFILFAGCDRSSTEREHGRPDVRHPHEREHRDFHRFDHSRVDRMADDLDLTSTQVETLKKLEKEIREKQLEMRKERRHRDVVKETIVEMIKKDSLSKEEIVGFMEEMHSMGEELRKETDSFVAERLAKMHAILTEEQREKLAKKLEEFQPRSRFKKKEDQR
jgi:Spy/CpxP family protein refolding chaperone